MLIANGEVFSEICKDRLIAINGDSKVIVAYKGDKVIASIKNGILTIKSKEFGKIVKEVPATNKEVCVDLMLEEERTAKVKYKNAHGNSISCNGNLIGNNCCVRILSCNENFNLHNGINLGIVSYGNREREEKVSSLGDLKNISNKENQNYSSLNKEKSIKITNKKVKIKNVTGQRIDLGVNISSKEDLKKMEGPIVINNSGRKITGRKMK